MERSLLRSVLLSNKDLVDCMFMISNPPGLASSNLFFHPKLLDFCVILFRWLYNNSLSGVIPKALCQNSYPDYQLELFPTNGVFTCPLPICCVSPSCSVQGYSPSCSDDTTTTPYSTSTLTSNLFCCYYDSSSQPAISICSSSSCPPPPEGYSFFSSAPTPSCSRCST